MDNTSPHHYPDLICGFSNSLELNSQTVKTVFKTIAKTAGTISLLSTILSFSVSYVYCIVLIGVQISKS